MILNPCPRKHCDGSVTSHCWRLRCTLCAREPYTDYRIATAADLISEGRGRHNYGEGQTPKQKRAAASRYRANKRERERQAALDAIAPAPKPEPFGRKPILTDELIAEIRAATDTYPTLAARYNVSRSTIANIKQRRAHYATR